MSAPFAYQKAASLISLHSQELSEGRRVTGRDAGSGRKPCSVCVCKGPLWQRARGLRRCAAGWWAEAGSCSIPSPGWQAGGFCQGHRVTGRSLGKEGVGRVAQIQQYPRLLCSSSFSCLSCRAGGVVPRQPLAGRCRWPWKAMLKWLIVQIKPILLPRLFVAVRHLHREVPVDLNLTVLSQQD